jgi:predicted Zn-dependent protease
MCAARCVFHVHSYLTTLLRCAAAVSAISLASCDGSTTSKAPPTSALTLAEFDDSTRAIETYIAANRTREAELIARKLLEHAIASDASDQFGRRAHEYAARAFFARAELAKAELSHRDREQLVREAAAEAALASVAPAPVETIRFAAMLADQVGNRPQAQELYERAVDAAPTDIATLLPAVFSALACDATNARVDRYAALHTESAPDAAWTAGLHAEIALARNEPARALEFALTATQRDNDALEFRMILAKALRANNRAVDAARMLSALTPQERARPALALQFALALAESNDLPAAAKAWEAALAANPDDAFTRAETALAFLRIGDTTRAAVELDALNVLYGGATQRVRIEPLIAALRSK